MCQVVIPSTPVVNPNIVITEQDTAGFAQSLRASRNTGEGWGDLAGNGDFSTGYYGASGGAGAQGNYAQSIPPAETVPEGEGFDAINSVLEQNLNQNWQEIGTPGNPNILGCYEVAGQSYSGDGTPWCAGYVSYVLNTAGIECLRTLSSQGYKQYGSEIDWRTFENVRTNDIVILTRNSDPRFGHVGFFRGYNPSTRRVQMLGGNQSNTVKLSNFLVRGDKMTLTSIKRNWTVPEKYNFPVIGTDLASGNLDSYASTR
jgi:uncharacterized protein (TIGR02594 family)